jgi:carbon-monoxide dehydrogenase catalytic subunit
MPPVLHLGSCVDNTRILTVLTQMASEGGLGDDISDIPAVGLAPEWMSEKALSIATYAVASGAYVIMGTTNPVRGSEEVQRLMSDDWRQKFGGRLEFILNPDEILQKTLAHIDERRAALKLPAYDPSKWGKSGDERMLHLVQLPFAERQTAMYGEVV